MRRGMGDRNSQVDEFHRHHLGSSQGCLPSEFLELLGLEGILETTIAKEPSVLPQPQ